MDQRSSSVDSVMIADVVNKEVQRDCQRKLEGLPKSIADDVLESMRRGVSRYRTGDIIYYTADVSSMEQLIRERSVEESNRSASRYRARALLSAMASRDLVREITGLSFQVIGEIRNELNLKARSRARPAINPTVMDQNEIKICWEEFDYLNDVSMRLLRVAAETRFSVMEIWAVVGTNIYTDDDADSE